MRYLVTGGAGFLGANLARKLTGLGHKVVVLDNLISGRSENLAGVPGVDFVEADVSMPFDVPGSIYGIYHLASIASPVFYQKCPIETLIVGARGTENVLDFACRRGVRTLIASTSEVYGDPLVHPQTEGYWGNVNPIGPRSMYDESKRYAEALAFAYHRGKGADIAVARIFNTYGPGMRHDDGRAVPAFIMQALAGRPLTVHGDGSQTRSFCYVDDLMDGLMAVYESGRPGPYNVGNPSEKTVRELAEIIIRLCGSGSELRFENRPPDDPCRRMPDISKIKSELGWEPTTRLEDGLRRTIEYFRSRFF